MDRIRHPVVKKSELHENEKKLEESMAKKTRIKSIWETDFFNSLMNDTKGGDISYEEHVNADPVLTFYFDKDLNQGLEKPDRNNTETVVKGTGTVLSNNS